MAMINKMTRQSHLKQSLQHKLPAYSIIGFLQVNFNGKEASLHKPHRMNDFLCKKNVVQKRRVALDCKGEGLRRLK